MINSVRNIPNTEHQPVRVFIQQNSVSHYRGQIFELLCKRTTEEFTLVADMESETPYLKTIDDPYARGIRQIPVRTRIIRAPYLSDIYWQPQTLRAVWRDRPNVVIAMGSPYSLTAWALCLLGKMLGIPVLLWTHGLLGTETGPKWWIRSALYRLASGLLLYGNHAKKLLTQKGLNPAHMYVVYNSLDYDLQSETAERITESERSAWRTSLGVKPGEGLVVFTGRLQRVKRLDLLIEAIATLAKDGKRVHAALIGDGSEKNSLMTLAQQLGISDLVHFVGENYDERYLGTALSASDLSVIPSGAGLSIMHAMTYGTPVLIHDRIEEHFPEWEAVQDGVTGFFYRHGDVKDLAAKLAYVIDASENRSQIAENCRAIIRDRYNPHHQVKIIISAVRTASTGRKRDKF